MLFKYHLIKVIRLVITFEPTSSRYMYTPLDKLAVLQLAVYDSTSLCSLINFLTPNNDI